MGAMQPAVLTHNSPSRYRFQAFGLNIQSSHELPALVAASGESEPDVRLRLIPEDRPAISRPRDTTHSQVYFSPYSEADGQPSLVVTKDSEQYVFAYHDGTEFVIDRSALSITCTYSSSLVVEDVALYFMGPVLAFVLRLRGMVCLHASAVALENHAVVFMGAAGTGKSTTAAAFAVAGRGVLSDDVAPIVTAGEQLLIQPAYPRVRLWPDSVEALFGAPDALPLLTPNWTKRYLRLGAPGFAFQRERLPIGAVYFLDGIETGANCPISAVAPADALLILARHAYTGYISDEEMRSREFPTLARLARSIPFRRIPGGLATEQVFQRRAAIESDFLQLLNACQNS